MVLNQAELDQIDAERYSTLKRALERGAELTAHDIAFVKAFEESAGRCDPVTDAALKAATAKTTFVQSFNLIERTAPFVDHYKVGTLNYGDQLPKDFKRPWIDWTSFGRSAVMLLDKLGKSYYIKKDLSKHMGSPDGIMKGDFPK